MTDAIEIYIIELPKVEKYKRGEALDLWVEFIKNPKVINMSNGEIEKASLKKASKALENFPKEVAINGKYNKPYYKGKIKI